MNLEPRVPSFCEGSGSIIAPSSLLLLWAPGSLIVGLVTTNVRGGLRGHDIRSQKTKSKAYVLGCEASNSVE